MPKENMPKGVFVRVQQNGWMTEELMCPNAALGRRGMLVLDAFHWHLTETVRSCTSKMKTNLTIPGGMTSQLQVLDVVGTCKIKKVLPDILVKWILVSWQQISKDSIIQGFKKCCISNALHRSEDDLLWSAPGGDLSDDDTEWERGSGDSSSSDHSMNEDSTSDTADSD
ncbi:hypothetical protein PR048_001361 [Dryococelus australis]|uniref:DDE-1 domain-containing protein n=1 Tax=Dryococelus australis TaxID=614101 RepID=A0ABQ9IIM4_9NEOP|nr:hypothetical protein PR048_001361 [Dryococelus australis]